jgi:sporulation initiation factor Spo0A C-terminal domain protein
LIEFFKSDKIITAALALCVFLKKSFNVDHNSRKDRGAGKMKKNILICEDSVEFGKSLAEKLKKRKFDTFVIENNIAKIKNRINCFRYDAIVLNPIGSMERYYRIIKRFSVDFPAMQIIAVTYSGTHAEHARLLEAGADRCLVMPMRTERIADFVSVQLVCAEHDEISPEMAGFLVESGFKDYKKAGFRYLCIAIELCIQEPLRIKSLMTSVYGEIGEKTGTNASCVERTIRYMVDHAENGLIERITNGRFKDNITNGALISALCQNYRKSMDILLLKAS